MESRMLDVMRRKRITWVRSMEWDNGTQENVKGI